MQNIIEGFQNIITFKMPFIGRMKWAVKFYFEKLKWKRDPEFNRSQSQFDINNVYWIDPLSIRYFTSQKFSEDSNTAFIWPKAKDFPTQPIEALQNYQTQLGSRTPLSLDTLYNTQPPALDSSQACATILIGKHGDIILNGSDDSYFENLKDDTSMPVRILGRHKKWVQFRNELLAYGQVYDNLTYQKVEHVDLANIPALHDSSDRFTMIKNHMQSKGGKLLDIGANLGYFSNRFEQEGFECFAVEASPKEGYFIKKIKRARNANFHIINKSIFSYHDLKHTSFDVVLALNIFHHFLKSHRNYVHFKELLQSMQMKEMFFQPHLPDEDQMDNAYKNCTPEEFVDIIIENTCLNKATYLGKASDGRKVYHIV